MNNQHELHTRWSALQEAKREFLLSLEKFEGNLFHAQPENGWSAAQVCEHILLSETGTFGYMKKKSSGGWEQLEVTSENEIGNSQAINNRLSSTERYKAPAILPDPPNKVQVSEVIHQWNALRSEMEDFLLSIDPVFYDRLVFRQPIAGMLNTLQTLEFLRHHLDHHIPQVERIWKEIHV